MKSDLLWLHSAISGRSMYLKKRTYKNLAKNIAKKKNFVKLKNKNLTNKYNYFPKDFLKEL